MSKSYLSIGEHLYLLERNACPNTKIYNEASSPPDLTHFCAAWDIQKMLSYQRHAVMAIQTPPTCKQTQLNFSNRPYLPFQTSFSGLRNIYITSEHRPVTRCHLMSHIYMYCTHVYEKIIIISYIIYLATRASVQIHWFKDLPAQAVPRPALMVTVQCLFRDLPSGQKKCTSSPSCHRRGQVNGVSFYGFVWLDCTNRSLPYLKQLYIYILLSYNRTYSYSYDSFPAPDGCHPPS